MRQLLPGPAEVDPVAAYLAAPRPQPRGRPWVTVGMISSLDGASATDGRSGGLGGPADRDVLRAVRALADVILVGAGTVRAERYGPVRISDHVRDLRVAHERGAPPPTLAVVSASLALDADSPMFTEAEARPLVFTVEGADPARREALAAVADVEVCGEHAVSLDAVLARLHDGGTRHVVCEGGPTLNGALVDADAVDELCLTISPRVAGGSSNRIVHGAEAALRSMTVASLLVEDDQVFGRWVRRAGAGRR